MAVVAVVALVLARDFWWPGRYVVAFDTVAYSGPNLDLTVDAWRDGRVPFRNPFIFGGVSHIGNPQAGIFHPPKVLALLFDTNRAMGVLVALHVVVLGVGMVLLVRRLGVRSPGGLVAGLITVANGAVMTRAVQFEQILVLAWAPLLLLALTAVVDADRRSPLAIAGLAGTTALTVVAGHPQIVHQIVVMATVWLAALLWTRRSWARASDVAIGLGIGASLAAPHLVAAIVATGDSALGLGRSLDELEDPALSARPEFLARIVLGSVRRVEEARFAGGFESIGHVGAVAATLAVIGLVQATARRSTRALGIAVAALVVLGVVWALGPRTPVFTVAYRIVPGFDLVRASARWLDISVLAVAIAAGWGIEAIRRRTRHVRLGAAIAGGALLAVLALGSLGALELADRWSVAFWVALTTGAAAVAVAPHVVQLHPRSDRSTWRWMRDASLVAAVAVSALLAVELAGTARSPVSSSLVRSRPIEALPADVGGQLAGRPGLTIAFTDDGVGDPAYYVAGFRPNTNVLHVVRSVDGYDGGVQVTQRFADLIERVSPDPMPELPLRNNVPVPLQPELAADLGIRYVLLDLDRSARDLLPGWRPTSIADEEFGVWENPAWVGDAIGRSGDGQVRPLPVIDESSTHVQVVVDASVDETVVLHRQAGPGWSVVVDGRAAELSEIEGFFLGVEVPAGTRTVEFRFAQPWWRASVVAVLPGLLGLVGLVAWSRRGRSAETRSSARGDM